MDRFTITVEGADELLRKMERISKSILPAVDSVLMSGAQATRQEAVRLITAHASRGRTYQRGNVKHTASAPNNPPNSDTGNLLNNVTVERIKGGYDVGSRKGAPYGRYLELGTPHMMPRPWLRPSYRVGIAKAADMAEKWLAKVGQNG